MSNTKKTTFSSAFYHAASMEKWQYVPHPDFAKYVHWDKIASGNPNGNILLDFDNKPAVCVIIGEVATRGMAMAPHGNFNPDYGSEITNAKLVCNLQRPSNDTIFASDFDLAIQRLEALQTEVATGVNRSYFVDLGTQTARFTHPLMTPKLELPDEEEEGDSVDEDDSLSSKNATEDVGGISSKKSNERSGTASTLDLPPSEQSEAEKLEQLRYEAKERAIFTAKYPIGARFKIAFDLAIETHDVVPLHVFKYNGNGTYDTEPIKPSRLPYLLPGALVEMMFTLKHHYIQFETKNNIKTSVKKNVYTAAMQELTVLKLGTTDSLSPARSPSGRITLRPAPSSSQLTTAQNLAAKTFLKKGKAREIAPSSSSNKRAAEDEAHEVEVEAELRGSKEPRLGDD